MNSRQNAGLDDALGIVVALILTVVTVGILLPTGIALARKSPDLKRVVVLNTLGLLLFGIGWVAALIVALMPQAKARPRRLAE